MIDIKQIQQESIAKLKQSKRSYIKKMPTALSGEVQLLQLDPVQITLQSPTIKLSIPNQLQYTFTITNLTLRPVVIYPVLSHEDQLFITNSNTIKILQAFQSFQLIIGLKSISIPINQLIYPRLRLYYWQIKSFTDEDEIVLEKDQSLLYNSDNNNKLSNDIQQSYTNTKTTISKQQQFIQHVNRLQIKQSILNKYKSKMFSPSNISQSIFYQKQSMKKHSGNSNNSQQLGERLSQDQYWSDEYVYQEMFSPLLYKDYLIELTVDGSLLAIDCSKQLTTMKQLYLVENIIQPEELSSMTEHEKKLQLQFIENKLFKQTQRLGKLKAIDRLSPLHKNIVVQNNIIEKVKGISLETIMERYLIEYKQPIIVNQSISALLSGEFIQILTANHFYLFRLSKILSYDFNHRSYGKSKESSENNNMRRKLPMIIDMNKVQLPEWKKKKKVINHVDKQNIVVDKENIIVQSIVDNIANNTNTSGNLLYTTQTEVIEDLFQINEIKQEKKVTTLSNEIEQLVSDNKQLDRDRYQQKEIEVVKSPQAEQVDVNRNTVNDTESKINSEIIVDIQFHQEKQLQQQQQQQHSDKSNNDVQKDIAIDRIIDQPQQTLNEQLQQFKQQQGHLTQRQQLSQQKEQQPQIQKQQHQVQHLDYQQLLSQQQQQLQQQKQQQQLQQQQNFSNKQEQDQDLSTNQYESQVMQHYNNLQQDLNNLQQDLTHKQQQQQLQSLPLQQYHQQQQSITQQKKQQQIIETKQVQLTLQQQSLSTLIPTPQQDINHKGQAQQQSIISINTNNSKLQQLISHRHAHHYHNQYESRESLQKISIIEEQQLSMSQSQINSIKRKPHQLLSQSFSHPNHHNMHITPPPQYIDQLTTYSQPVLACYIYNNTQQQTTVHLIFRTHLLSFPLANPQLQTTIKLDPMKQADTINYKTILIPYINKSTTTLQQLIIANGCYIYWISIPHKQSQWKYCQRKQIYCLQVVEQMGLLAVGGKNFSKLSYFGKQTSRSNIKIYTCGKPNNRNHLFTYDIPINDGNVGNVIEMKYITTPPAGGKLLCVYTNYNDQFKRIIFLRIRAYNIIEIYGSIELTEIGIMSILSMKYNPKSTKLLILEQVDSQHTALKRLKVKTMYQKVQILTECIKTQLGNYSSFQIGGDKQVQWYSLVKKDKSSSLIYRTSKFYNNPEQITLKKYDIQSVYDINQSGNVFVKGYDFVVVKRKKKHTQQNFK